MGRVEVGTNTSLDGAGENKHGREGRTEGSPALVQMAVSHLRRAGIIPCSQSLSNEHTLMTTAHPHMTGTHLLTVARPTGQIYLPRPLDLTICTSPRWHL
jgi:hypothetical protein